MNIKDYLKDYNHPKADADNFWADDFVEVGQETNEKGWTEILYKNSGGRLKMKEIPPDRTESLPNIHYPGGGCDLLNGMPFCSFEHINWQIPTKLKSTTLA